MQSRSRTITITYLMFLLFICGCSANKPDTPTVVSTDPISPVSTASASNAPLSAVSSDQNYYSANAYDFDTITPGRETSICTAVVDFLRKTGQPKPIGIAILAETDNVNIVSVDMGTKGLLYLSVSGYHRPDGSEYWKASFPNALTLKIAGMSDQVAEEKADDKLEGERQDAAHDASQSSGGTD